MMNLEANIFPQFDFAPDDLLNIGKMLGNLPELERHLIESPLGQSPVLTLARTEFDAGMEHSVGVMDSYQFIITRRFKLHGEWHVGGANGEILNVYTFLSEFKAALEAAAALRDSND